MVELLEILLKIHAQHSTQISYVMEAAAEYYLSYDFWKKEYLVFLTFKDNLLASNHLFILVSSSFIFSNKMLMSLCRKKRFVSSANMIEVSTFEV